MSGAAATDASLDPLIDHLRARLGLAISAERTAPLQDAIRRAMCACGVRDPVDFLPLLQTDNGVFDAIVAEVTVGETYFFRDPNLFGLVRKLILPEILRSRTADAPIRIWSAGCATGEEAYTLAILMEEERLEARARILATDVSRQALRRARAGLYSRWSLRSDTGQLAKRYFTSEGDRLRLADRFRERVSFKFLNLATEFTTPSSAPPPSDLILCRNVLIYLDPVTIRQVARRLFDSLADGGWLLTGPSDPPLWNHAPFRTMITSSGVLYRRENRTIVQQSTGQASRLRTPPPSQPQPPAVERVEAMPKAQAPRRAAPAAAPKRPQHVVKGCTGLQEIRALADRGELAAAEEALLELLARDALSVEARHLLAVLHLAAGRTADAIGSLRRLIYLDPNVPAAHLMLGALLERQGDLAGARRAFEVAFATSAERPPHESTPLSGETAGALALTAKRRIDQVIASPGVDR